MSELASKYWAFVSYSHRDKAIASWMHSALERYRVPRRLVGRIGRDGAVPALPRGRRNRTGARGRARRRAGSMCCGRGRGVVRDTRPSPQEGLAEYCSSSGRDAPGNSVTPYRHGPTAQTLYNSTPRGPRHFWASDDVPAASPGSPPVGKRYENRR